MRLKYKLPNLTNCSQSAVPSAKTTYNTIPGLSAIGICAKQLTIEISWQFPDTDLA
ncbi:MULTISPECIES: hypothetical protein [unclassified Microcoleus]|uniref:hypothetical protein n=1 Tax=unclassified Microcoleus TaxID=2642155 RepID=UPI002FD17A32